MTILESKQRVARKEHKCNFCGGKIDIGETYEWQKNVYDGDLYEWKTHTKCNGIALTLNMYEECDEGVTGDDFVVFITDEFHYLNKDAKYTKIPFKDMLEFVIEHYNKNEYV